MRIGYRTNENILYLAVEGRIDASNAHEAEAQILAIKEMTAKAHTVIDAENLQYISSAGLRIILKLLRVDPALAAINVSPEVYEILEMTGFTDMMTVKKAYRKVSVEGCEFIAKGANGAVYRYDEETIVKVYFSKDALPEIRQERENARRAFVLGINTAIPYDIVRVGDGYGSVTELLDAMSVAKLLREDPTHPETAARYFVDMLKRLHTTSVEDGSLPDMQSTVLSWVEFVSPHLSPLQAEKLLTLVISLPKRNTLVHGDYHPGNVMIQNGEPLLIDMDTLGMGHPIFELASMFNALIGFYELKPEDTESFYGFDYATSVAFWNMTLRMYLDTEDEALCKSVTEKAMILGYVRILRRALRRPNEAESPARIAHCKEMLGRLLKTVNSLDF